MPHAVVKAKKRVAPRPTAKRSQAKGARRRPSEPAAAEIEARKSVARTLFDANAAAAARGSFLKRQQGGSANDGSANGGSQNGRSPNGRSANGGTAHAG